MSFAPFFCYGSAPLQSRPPSSRYAPACVSVSQSLLSVRHIVNIVRHLRFVGLMDEEHGDPWSAREVFGIGVHSVFILFFWWGSCGVGVDACSLQSPFEGAVCQNPPGRAKKCRQMRVRHFFYIFRFAPDRPAHPGDIFGSILEAHKHIPDIFLKI